MDKALKEFATLKKEYPKAHYYLDFKTPFQLLVGTILSAQCTDERANMVLQELFRKYKGPEDFAKMNISKLESEIKSAGFYRSKAKGIHESAKIILERFSGKVPDRMEDLVTLPGVGRKTANAILQNAFNKVEGVVVDTHVIRLSQRLGWSKSSEPEKIEQDLMRIFPKREWGRLPHILKAHGRNVCKAPVPSCSKCILNKTCPKIGVTKSK
ncbi:MAG: endonuclease III [Nanoarchaeota archaeon]